VPANDAKQSARGHPSPFSASIAHLPSAIFDPQIIVHGGRMPYRRKWGNAPGATKRRGREARAERLDRRIESESPYVVSYGEMEVPAPNAESESGLRVVQVGERGGGVAGVAGGEISLVTGSGGQFSAPLAQLDLAQRWEIGGKPAVRSPSSTRRIPNLEVPHFLFNLFLPLFVVKHATATPLPSGIPSRVACTKSLPLCVSAGHRWNQSDLGL
jgi:hypothetical protein